MSDMISPAGREVLAELVRDSWEACARSPEVEEVLVYLHLDEGGFMVEPAYRVGRRWWSGQFLDQALSSPIGSDERNDQLTDELAVKLLQGAAGVLQEPSPRPSRIVARWTAPDGGLQLDASDEPFDLTRTTTFDVFEAWWAEVERTGETSVSS
ncbi:hypothetical protein [Auraticoccus monumenti]|uniref:Uncharacterized protein n=1 Tax=Auraticoccus monumenti TaxID=675864 RepID=A0A1G6XIS1_9ACTN|nr:hypothetical protein [Auraticoccus monumenti]SDD78098.1 hypothetical protein SAMN04489747_1726 [Auraticoccus monumenti]